MLSTDNVPFTRCTTLILLLGILIGPDPISATESPAIAGQGQMVQTPDTPQASPQGRFRRPRRVEGYYKARITPHWFADNACFWYRNDLSGNTKEFILVNAERGTREAAFDHERLASALSKAAKADCRPRQLPFDSIEFLDGAQAIRFTVNQTTWKCDLTSYTCSETEAVESEASGDQDDQRSRFGRRRGPSRPRDQSADSPDGVWTALIKDNNVFVRPKDANEQTQLSTDGAEASAYGLLSWAPDSKTLVAFRIEPGDNKEVYLIESSPEDGGRAKFHSRPY
ncbi:MAG: hypothetical protein JSU70_04780, partial [Phycisphaerales bacterium]